jgi:hypothetical protein
MPKIITKKSTKNEYFLTRDGIWVRNFCKSAVPFVDINRMVTGEYQLLLSNEVENIRRRYVPVDSEGIVRRKVVIVSDGYGFPERQKMLAMLPGNEVTVIGVNKALSKWNLVGDDCPEGLKRAMAFYVVNNPYPEAMSFLPKKRYFPKCVASLRTHPGFLEAYRGNVYTYSPVAGADYAGPANSDFRIDDYRNPVCAALGLAHHFGAEKVMLFCCDDSFDGERPGAVRLENGLWHYPQQEVSHRIIDANLYWLDKSGVQVADFSSGPKYEHATYINDEKGMKSFFDGGNNE